jgi:glutamate synthase domain-containing protein 2
MNGLDVTNKAVRVANYAQRIIYEVGTISHSCGVREPRELTRKHARIVMENGRSISLAELYPDKVPAHT